MNFRTGLRATGLVCTIALVSLAGCSGNSSPSENSSQGLRVVVTSEPISMNPVFSPYSDARTWGSMFDSLVGLNRQTLETNDQGLLPTWEREGDTKWVFDVRKGVKFHDDEDFSADAAAFTLKELRDNSKSILRSYYAVVKDAKNVDGKLVVTTTVPYSALPALMTNAFALPPDYYKKVGDAKFAQKPVGTGAFKLVSYKSGQGLNVKKFSDYWRDVPTVDSIKFSWSSEAASRYALLSSGQADFVYSLTPQDVAKVKEAKGLKISSGISTYGMTMFLNAQKGPLKDVKLRKAIAMSIDRKGLVNSVFQGTGAVPSYTFIGDLLHKPIKVKTDYDLKAAKALVKQAGTKPTIVFGYPSGHSTNDAQVGAAVTGMLKTAGFQVKQRAEEYGAYRADRDKGTFDVFMQQVSPTFSHPDTYVRYFMGKNATVSTCINDADYDNYDTEALNAKSDEKSDKIYAQLEKQALTSDYCYVPVEKDVYNYGMSDRVEGFKVPRDTIPFWYKLRLKK